MRLALRTFTLLSFLATIPDSTPASTFKLYATTSSGTVLKYDQTGAVTALPTSAGVYGITVSPTNGNLLVSGNSSVVQYTPTGTFVSGFGDNDPIGLATDSSGNIYVADPNRGGVIKFTSSGAVLSSFGTGLAAFGVAVDASGNVFISDENSNTIKEYDANGNAIRTLNSPNMAQPNQIVLDGLGNLYVTNAANARIEKFSALTGIYLGTFATGTANGAATGLAYDPGTGLFYQDNYGTSTIEQFSPTGVFMGHFATGVSSWNLALVSIPVPEPASLLMMGLGITGVAVWSRRGRRPRPVRN